MVVIHCDEDGDHFISVMSKEEVLERLNAEDEGDRFGPVLSWEDVKRRGSLDYVVGVILIDGNIVLPKVVERVTRYEL